MAREQTRVLRALWAVAGALLLVCGPQAAAAETAPDPAQEEAARILAECGVRGGLVVHVGCGAPGRAELTAALRAGPAYVVQGLDREPADVERARQHVRSLGLYGPVSVNRWDGLRLPYVDNLVNLIVAEEAAQVPAREMLRVLAPDGVACVMQADGHMTIVKPRPTGIDEWTHYLHDAGGNAVARDRLVGPPARFQWVAGPRWARHHEHVSSTSALVSAGGRVFCVMDEGPRESVMLPARWRLVARDAFNGVLLWKRPIDDWVSQQWPLKSGPAQLPRRLVASGDLLYVTPGLDAPLAALDAATGRTLLTYEGTDGTEEMILHDGVLFLLVCADAREHDFLRGYRRSPDSARYNAELGRSYSWKWEFPQRTIMALSADDGETLWQRADEVAPLTLAADGQRVFYHDGQKVVCLDRGTGEPLWTSEPVEVAEIPPYFAPTLVVCDDIVLVTGGKRALTALSARDGRTLWTSDYPKVGHVCPEDLFVIRGVVWAGEKSTHRPPTYAGRDILTGAVQREFSPDASNFWFHRCYRSKATERYIMPSNTGVEFVDLESEHWTMNNWVRGACAYGVMPANGLLYAPPHPCACYMESMLTGFCALASADGSTEPHTAGGARLVPGPAYGQEPESPPGAGAADEWPTYRHDATRSGATASSVPITVSPAWQAEPGGTPSAPVVAEGKLFVASVDTHTVHAFDAVAGEPAWSYTAGGRVDSPPTIWRGRAIFGSADGWVYCLRASDGALIWRHRAAPQERLMMACGQPESVWPVHGSVLVHEGVVYCVAGRSAFLDGGMRLLRIEAASGLPLSETLLDDCCPGTSLPIQSRLSGQNMAVALPDVLSCDGRNVYMRSQPFDLQGVPIEVSPATDATRQAGEGVHLFCPAGFLDDSYFHRSYWMFGSVFKSGNAGWYRAARYAPSGRLLVFDGDCVYGYGRKPHYYMWRSELDHHLFCAGKLASEDRIRHVHQRVDSPNVAYNVSRDRALMEARSVFDVSAVDFRWSRDALPLHVRAVTLAGGTLFIAGPPLLITDLEAARSPDNDELHARLTEQAAALEAESGGLLQAVSAWEGTRLAQVELDAPPVWDGMAAAYGRLYAATTDGRVVCFAARQ